MRGGVRRPIDLARRQLILVGGKGGVGKTTVAAATAACLARKKPKQRVLLFSTDPAHSLADSLSQEVGSTATEVAGVDGLFAMAMNAAELLEDFKNEYAGEIRDFWEGGGKGSIEVQFDGRVMEELLALTPPGIDELVALMEIMSFMENGDFDRCVLDLAPTGHALRLLEMPGVMRQWFTLFLKLLLKYDQVLRVPRLSELVRRESKRVRSVQKLLTDPERCAFVTVAIPEAMAVLETKRLLDRLAELSVPYAGLVVNMVMPRTQCPFCAAVREEQERHISELDGVAPGFVSVPLFPYEVTGIDALAEMAGTIYGETHGRRKKRTDRLARAESARS